MTDPLFLAILDEPAVGQQITLSAEEAHHAVTVRRLRPGEIILISDGNGTAVRGPVLTADKAGLSITVDEVLREPEPSVRYVAVQALPKGDRAEQSVETLTELGVDEIVPWQAERSVVRWTPDRVERGLTRWRSAAREAAKQSRRLRLPTVAMPTTTAELAQRIARADLALILHETATRPLAGLAVPATGEVLFVIGPEGGLSDDEVTEFTEAGGIPVRIAEAVLRTSTAGVVALAQLQALAVRG